MGFVSLARIRGLMSPFARVGRALAACASLLSIVGCADPVPFAPTTRDGGGGGRDASIDAAATVSDGGDAGATTDPDAGHIERIGPFDPDAMYLYTGIEAIDDCTDGVILALDGSGMAWAGFECGATRHLVRADGTIVYLDTRPDPGFTGDLRTFVPETWSIGAAYPATPAGNDPELDSSECSANVAAFLARPGSNDILYLCRGCTMDCVYHGPDGTFDPPSASAWLGYGGRMLVSPYSLGVEFGVLDAAGERVGPADPPDGEVVAVRAHPDGFHLVTQRVADDPLLTHIALDGTTTPRGTYASIDTAVYLADLGCALDAADRLYCVALARTASDAVLRFAPDGSAPVVVLDDSTAMGLEVAGRLVTGR